MMLSFSGSEKRSESEEEAEDGFTERNSSVLADSSNCFSLKERKVGEDSPESIVFCTCGGAQRTSMRDTFVGCAALGRFCLSVDSFIKVKFILSLFINGK